MSQKFIRDPLIKNILDDLESRFSDHIVSVFGIGSYFDGNLPPNWIKNDVDLVVIVDSLEGVPKQDWTEVRYEKKQLGDKEIWIGFNSLEGVKNRELFRKQSFANFEWSLLELKLPENSALLYGRNIRDELPEISALQFDYDNVLIRSLYHLNNSFKEGVTPKAMREFTKGAFKFGFYLCVYFDPQFRFTSIVKIAEEIKLLVSDNKIDRIINSYIEEAVIYRMTSQFKSEFESLRDDFVKFVFSSLESGSVHQKVDKTELIKLLSKSFGGLGYLVRFARKLEALETPKIVEDEDFSFAPNDSQLKIIDIKSNMKSITIYGRIKEIYSKFRFERVDGNEGQGASFLLHDPTGDIRVVLWDKHSKVFTRNEFSVNELVKILNGYAKKGRAGTEIQVGKYGSIILSPEGVDLAKHPELKDSENSAKRKEFVTQIVRSMGIEGVKVKKIICPFCSSMCSTKLKFCGVCGEPLPKA
ncbi:hypothetical protein ES705_25949 [subsurface metagenome]